MEGTQQDTAEMSGLLMKNKSEIHGFMRLGSPEDITYPLYLPEYNMEVLCDQNFSFM